jgi:hypothetical protein
MNLVLFASVVTLLTCFVVVAVRLLRADQPLRNSYRSGSFASRATPVSTAGTRHFRATAIETRGLACPEVRSLLNVPLLDEHGSPPPLPLDGCSLESCNCCYVRYADRRGHGRDRRNPVSLQAQMFRRSGKTDQRLAVCGRRISDLDLWVSQM